MANATTEGGGGGGSFKGMNPEVVKTQANHLENLAGEIQKLIHKLETETQRLQEAWRGPDSKRFQSQWEGEHKASLKHAKKLIEEMAQTAKAEAKQQVATSQ
jgi:WXG100 family type VII secretion target